MAQYGLRLLISLSLLQLGTCYPSFQQNIPNGEIVPSPCNPNHVWQGVGHLAKGGGGDNNPFGLDFKGNGYSWTEELCWMDSDGDGKTNGQELGDPDCNWQRGGDPATTLGLSHPGICDPIDSPQCQGMNEFLECGTEEFVCEALSDPDIVSRTIRLTETAVPAKETTYICQVVDLPTDNDYHLVAIEPYIDNINVMHHIIVYGCKDEANISAAVRQPNECFMTGLEGCEDILAIWAVGGNGICYHEDAGFRIGSNGFKTALIEMHWNNPMEEPSYTDSSGMSLYLTTNLRPNEAGMLMIGQSLLIIPPGREEYSTNSSCSPMCTAKKMRGSIHIIGALNHMHYLGSSAKTWMVDHDGNDHVIAADPEYNYDSPKFYVYDEPIEVEPGYELRLHCGFKSTARSKTTFYGEGTLDEMCFAFLMYYPKENWRGSGCFSTGTIDTCEWEEPIVKGCDIRKISDPSDPENIERYTAVQENCKIGICLEECKDVVREISTHPCFQWPLNYIMQEGALQTDDQATKSYLLDYYNRVDSCAAELAKESCKDDDMWPHPEVGGSQGMHLTSLVFIVGVALSVTLL